MMLASITVRGPSTITGIRFSGHTAACSAIACGLSGPSMRNSNGVVVLVERDEHFLAIGRERMGVQLHDLPLHRLRRADVAHCFCRLTIDSAARLGFVVRSWKK